jgi:hypothetical protein
MEHYDDGFLPELQSKNVAQKSFFPPQILVLTLAS